MSDEPTMTLTTHERMMDAAMKYLEERNDALSARVAELEGALADADPLRSTVSFLSSVIRCSEPFTPDVEQAVDNAFERLDRMAAAAGSGSEGHLHA